MTKSTYLEVAGFHVVYAITQEEEGPPLASALLRVEDEGGKALELSGGDAITCDGAALLPSTSRLPDRLHGYEVAVAADQPDHRFVFSRPGMPPITHLVETPAALDVTVVPVGTGEPSSELLVRWAAAIPQAKVRIDAHPGDGRCSVITIVEAAPDEGALTFPRDRLAPPAASEEGPAPASCAYRLLVTRTRAVSVGAPFHGGERRSIARARSPELP